MVHRPATGRSVATRRAIEEIVATAARASYGIAGLGGRGFQERFVRSVTGREPAVTVLDTVPLSITVHVQVAFGLPVAEVARQLDSAIRHAVRKVIGREVADLTVDVAGLEYRPGNRPGPVVRLPEPQDGAA